MSGPFGEKPTIKIAAPLKLSESESWTTVTGKGDSVGSDATVILQLTLADGRTGKTACLHPRRRPASAEIKLGDQVFPSLAKALVGKAAVVAGRRGLHLRRRVRRHRRARRSASRAATRS